MNKAIAIDSDMTIKKAAKIMSKRRIGSLIVLKEDKIAGIVTEHDIMENVSSPDKRVSSIMSRKVRTLDHDDSIDNAAMFMAKHKIKRLPITEKGKLVGIITATNILANSDILNGELFD